MSWHDINRIVSWVVLHISCLMVGAGSAISWILKSCNSLCKADRRNREFCTCQSRRTLPSGHKAINVPNTATLKPGSHLATCMRLHVLMYGVLVGRETIPLWMSHFFRNSEDEARCGMV
ncbi:hypothetical protein DL546_004796 [Coniochaeta pulveracea]|uniref:Uncharacterized protein n=1 Tax=Coniochaeta pulveracea TaxID=177199 RepID=A0A420Y1I4_9PEZI|nr:hypothetical protein DL546_004796 [Coniochaeta pulveracea]